MVADDGLSRSASIYHRRPTTAASTTVVDNYTQKEMRPRQNPNTPNQLDRKRRALIGFRPSRGRGLEALEGQADAVMGGNYSAGFPVGYRKRICFYFGPLFAFPNILFQ